MSGARRIISSVSLVAVVAAAGWIRFSWVADRTPTQRTIAVLDRKLPWLPVTDESNARVDLSKLVEGRRSVIVFYSSACPACQSALSRLQPFPTRLRLILVAEGTGVMNGDPGVPGLRWALKLRDPESSFRRSFPMSPVPTILFVDEEGVLRETLVGESESGRLQIRLNSFAEALR